MICGDDVELDEMRTALGSADGYKIQSWIQNYIIE